MCPRISTSKFYWNVDSSLTTWHAMCVKYRPVLLTAIFKYISTNYSGLPSTLLKIPFFSLIFLAFHFNRFILKFFCILFIFPYSNFQHSLFPLISYVRLFPQYSPMIFSHAPLAPQNWATGPKIIPDYSPIPLVYLLCTTEKESQNSDLLLCNTTKSLNYI